MMRRMKKRGGQAAVLIALSLFSLVIFVAFATNMGILVNDKIRIQNAADMGSYSAAYREAQVLNKLTTINQEILGIARDCRQVLESRIWQGVHCACVAISEDADDYIDSCESDIRAKVGNFLQTAGYSASVGSALAVARDVMDGNVPDLGSSTGTHFFETSLASPTSAGSGVTNSQNTITSFLQAESLFDYFVQPHCPCLAGCCYEPQVPRITPIPIDTYFFKPNTNPDIWVMTEASGTMSSSYLDIAYSPAGNDGGYFGGSSQGSSDLMTAVSVAKPFDGSVGPTYMYVNVDGAAGVGGFAAGNDAGSPIQYSEQFTNPELFMRPTYRARLAGVHEWDDVSADFKPASALSGNMVGPTNDPSRIHH